jgi:hypothetical protein
VDRGREAPTCFLSTPTVAARRRIAPSDRPRDDARRGWGYRELYHRIARECTGEPLAEIRTVYSRIAPARLATRRREDLAVG